MKNTFAVAAVLAMTLTFCGSSAQAQAQVKDAPKTVASILDAGVKGVEAEFVPAAEAMPEDKYGFAPANGEFKGVRTFGQQIKHVAAVNYMVAAAILQEKPPVELGGENGSDRIKSKADIMKFIKDSYAYAHKAVGTITPDNSISEVPSPFGRGKSTRMGLAILITAHSFDHYGQMVEYLRMNGIVPPASRQ